MAGHERPAIYFQLLKRTIMSKPQKLYFMKAPRHSGYHAGQVCNVPPALAKKFIEQGDARLATESLPGDIPGRDILIREGIESVDALAEIADLTKVKGIGKATAEQITEWLVANGHKEAAE